MKTMIITEINKLLEDPVNRSRYILKGDIITSKLIDVKDLSLILEKLDPRMIYYITIESPSRKLYLHLMVYDKTIIGCFNEISGLSSDKCKELLEQVKPGDKIRLIIYRLDPNIFSYEKEIVDNKLKEEITSTSRGQITSTQLESIVESREKGSIQVEGKPLSITDQTVSLELIEYEIMSEITKYGYLVEDVSITPTSRDVMVFLKLNPVEKPSSLKELLYIVAKHICSNFGSINKLGIDINYGKQKTLFLDVNNDSSLCIGLGLIPEILRNHGLQLSDLKMSKSKDTVIIDIKAKRLSQEISIDPGKAVRVIRDSLRNILGRNVKVKLSTGIIGGKYEA